MIGSEATAFKAIAPEELGAAPAELLAFLGSHGSALSRSERARLRDLFHNRVAEQLRMRRIDEEGFRDLVGRFIWLWGRAEARAYPEENRVLLSLTQVRKRVLVLISEGGGGHKSAGESLREILGNFYEVEVVNVFGEVLQPLDSLSVLTNRSLSGEELYNLFLRWGLHFITRCYVAVGNLYMHKNREKIEHLFSSYLDRSHRLPDLIISTIPVVNGGLITAASEKSIPFLLLPTDLDTKLCLNGLKELELSDHRLFRLALPYDDPDVRINVVQHSKLAAEQLEVTGFPVRRASRKKYTQKEIAALRKQHHLLEGYRTVTLLAGAQGGEVIFAHLKHLVRVEGVGQLEANICVGRNERLKEKMVRWLLRRGSVIFFEGRACTSLRTPEGVVLHVRGFFKEIIEVMACSELLITKTGSCSVNEGIYLGVPLLLDNTRHSSARHFWWEKFNLAFIQKVGAGGVFTHSKQLVQLVPRLLHQQNRESFPCFTPPDFAKNILRLVADMVAF